MDHNNQYSIINTNLSEKAFDAILNNIKIENNSLFNDESSDLEDSASIACMSIDKKDKKQDEICELASTSYDKDINVTKSNSQELTDTKLVDGEIVSMHTSSLSTALPITKISSKSTPHICLKHCFLCDHRFRVLDSPFHISQLRNTDKQNEFLKIDPSLCIDSCICDFCWKFLEKTYVSNNPNQVIEESFIEKRTKHVERYVNEEGKNYKICPRRICSIHFCSKPYHKILVNECENIKIILSAVEYSCPCVRQTSDFLTLPFYLCKDHNDLITLMSSCQICGCKLNEPFNPADWSMYKMWNRVLIENNLLPTLQHGMFICTSCREHISKPNPGFPTNDLPLFQKYMTMSNEICLKLYEESRDTLFNVNRGSKCVTSPIVVSKKKKVKFSHSLITRTFHYEVDFDENDIKSITSTALLNVAEQNLVVPKLEPQDEGERFKTFTTNKPTGQLCIFYSDSTPNKSDIEMTNSLNENVDYIPENILSEQNSLSNLTNNNVSNNCTVNLNETDNSVYSRVVAVEPSNVILNPVSIKRKSNNVICDTISNKNVKKPRVNEKYSFKNNNTNKPFREKNIVHPNKNLPNALNMIPPNCKNKYVLNSDFIGVQIPSSNVDEKSLKLHSSCSPKNIELSNNVKKYSRKGLKNDDVSDSETITLSEHGSDFEIKISDTFNLSDFEEFSETDSEEILSDIKENDFIVVDSDYNFDSDSECEKILKKTPHLNSLDGSNSEILPECIMRCGVERESAHEKSQLTVTDTEKVFNDKKSTSFKVVDKMSGYEVLLNDVKLFQTNFIDENKNKYFCAYDDEIEPSGDQGCNCMVLYDNVEDCSNKIVTTYKVNVEKGLGYKILLDEEKVEIVHDSENINKPSKILFSKKIESSCNKDASLCIFILDNEKENYNKKLSTVKTVFNINKSISKILQDGNELYGMRFEGRKDYIVSYIEIKSSGDDKQSHCLITHCGVEIIKKNVGNDSDNQEIDNKKVSDFIMPNHMINVDDDSHDVKELDKVQEYLKDIFSEIQHYFEATDNQSHKELYSKIGNGTGMLLYLMENMRMLYNEELAISKTANELSKNYLNQQKKILYSYFGDPNDSINASKPFIHPSSHLHQYSKRLSADSHLQSEMTTSSSLTKSNSNASKVQIQVSKGTLAYLKYMVLPYALKKKP